MVLVLDSINERLTLKRREGRLSSSQLKGVASVAPNVNFFAIELACVDLRSDPVESSALGLPLRVLVAEEGTKTEVCNLDLAIRAAKDVVTLDVTMQDVL